MIYVFLFVVIALIVQGFMLILSSWYMSAKNKRNNAFLQKIYYFTEQRLLRVVKYIKERF